MSNDVMIVSRDFYQALVEVSGGPHPIRDYDHIQAMKQTNAARAIVDAAERKFEARL